MFRHLTYKKKLLLLCSAFVIVLFVLYPVTIQRTIDEKNRSLIYQERLDGIQYAPTQISKLENELEGLEKLYGRDCDSSRSFQECLLEKVSSFCSKNRITLSEFPEKHLVQENDVEIETYLIKLQGNYTTLLKLLFDIEKSEQFGKVSSVEFFKEKNMKNNRIELYMTLYIQKINNSLQ